MDGLKPCPFCGNEKVTIKERCLTVFVYCDDCAVDGPPVYIDSDKPNLSKLSEKFAAKRWNTRN